MAKETYTLVAEEMSKVKDINNKALIHSGLIITWVFPTADKLGALINGRKLGDCLVDDVVLTHMKGMIRMVQWLPYYMLQK